MCIRDRVSSYVGQPAENLDFTAVDLLYMNQGDTFHVAAHTCSATYYTIGNADSSGGRYTNLVLEFIGENLNT